MEPQITPISQIKTYDPQVGQIKQILKKRNLLA